MNLCIPKSSVMEYYQFGTENPPHWMEEAISKKIRAFIDYAPVDDIRLIGEDGYVIKWDNKDILGRGETYYYYAISANEFHEKFSIVNEDTFKPIEENKKDGILNEEVLNGGILTIKDDMETVIKKRGADMLIKTQDGNYIKWDSISGLTISKPSCETDGYDLCALLGETLFLIAHCDEEDPCKDLMETIVTALFDGACVVDCSNGDTYRKREE